jgi:hypothetical protein
MDRGRGIPQFGFPRLRRLVGGTNRFGISLRFRSRMPGQPRKCTRKEAIRVAEGLRGPRNVGLSLYNLI